MRGNHVRRRLQAGEASIGTWLSLPSPEVCEYVGRLGFDWMVADAEHNAMDILTLSRMFTAIAATNTAPMVRIPWNDPLWFKQVLDAGAWGIVVPMVNSKEDAVRAVEATRYHPLGNRSVGGSRHALRFDMTGSDYYERANDEVLLVLQIEHIDGVEHADEILSVPGVDACFIGPNDLAASMGLGIGHPLESEHPRMIEAIEHVRLTADKCGIAPGIHTSGSGGVNQRLAEGFRLCAMSSELHYLIDGLAKDIQKLNWEAAKPHLLEDVEGDDIVRY